MLDKSVPYAYLAMHRKAGMPVPSFPLPPGFRFAMYSDGDEASWARIETSVLEFDSEFAALMYFKEKFLPHAGELRRRLVFAETDSGEKVATANAWWSVVKPDRPAWLTALVSHWSDNKAIGQRRPWIHWVSVDVRYQGLGLGKAVTARAMEIMRDIEGDTDMFLSTQTWSYKAIDIYKKCGFEPTDERIIYPRGRKRDYKKAMRILSSIEANRENNAKDAKEDFAK